MVTITSVKALQILDSRGDPTVEVKITLSDNSTHSASVPSGASTGVYEALELRDGDDQKYKGKGVLQAVNHVNEEINNALQNKPLTTLAELDQIVLDLDGTPNKSKLGANAILGTSIALVKALAHANNQQVYQYLRTVRGESAAVEQVPVPLFNIVNGGAHADNNIAIQEYMVIPKGIPAFADQLRAGSEIYHVLKKLFVEKELSTGTGNEGGFAPELPSDYAAMEFITQAIKLAGYKPGEEVFIGLDIAVSQYGTPQNGTIAYEFPHQGRDGELTLKTSQEIMNYYIHQVTRDFPILLVEDGLHEDDWNSWTLLTAELAQKEPTSILCVGDDFLVTNPERTKQAVEAKAVSGMIIKPNQIGTITEVLQTAAICDSANIVKIASHRSGETVDSFIAQLAVGINAQYLKDGAPAHGERVEKYNELLRISTSF